MMISFRRQALPFRADFSVAGTRCFLSTNSEDVLRGVARWSRGLPASEAACFRMEVLTRDGLLFDGTSGAHFRGLRHVVWAALPPHALLVYDLLRRRVQVALTAMAADDPEFWDSLLLPVTIGILGTTMGVAPLHCACLDRNGSAVLVAGTSGAGKSTLTTAMGKRGFAVVSDDWTYLRQGEGGLLAHGLGAPIKLLPDAKRFFSELRSFTTRATLNGEEAYELDAQKSMGFAVKEVAQPKWLFFLERTPKRGCQMVPCRAEYVREFFEGSAERLPAELPQAKDSRSKVIARLSECPAWILRTGENPQGTAEAIEQFLMERQRQHA